VRARDFAQVDVFSPVPLGGNPVAVVLDAEDLDDAAMHRFARWTDLSETTFVLPPAAPDADYRVRIFTTDRELPFAGHPTLGTCHAWLEATGRELAEGERIGQECGAGVVEVRRTAEGLAFAAPPLIRSGPVDDATLRAVTEAVGIDTGAVVDAQWADNGPGWVAVLLEDAAAVLALTPGPTELDIGVAGPCPPDDAAALEVRAFFPKDGSVGEDPVTGSLNAALAEWLLRTGRLRAPYIARQGTALGRTGRVAIDEDPDGTIWVGGATNTVLRGTARL
jgi:PhzF family phenazine biosynthesis protein